MHVSLTHLVIHKCVKVPTIFRLDVEKNNEIQICCIFTKMLSKKLQQVGKSASH